MSYSEEFKVYCSTIAGEAGGSSDEAIKTVARSIITRIGFREWRSRKNAFEVIKYSGYDAYTDRASSPNYKSVYKSMTNGKLNKLSIRIIKLVEPIYNNIIPDETGMITLYYSPRAQNALHKKYPRKYRKTPNWNFNQLEKVNIAGTENDDFKWYRYKGDGSTIKARLVNITDDPVPNKLITVKVTDRHGNYFVKQYKTDNKGEIHDIHARKKSKVEFFLDLDQRSCTGALIADGKPKKAVLKDYECVISSQTKIHKTTSDNSNEDQQESSSSSWSLSEENTNAKDAVERSIQEATFNIKLVEADTGKPLPNTTYYLNYKNNIKPHTTNESGVDANIRADICESINFLLNDDNGKQPIDELAFGVTEDLNQQTKVIKIPVVSFNVNFVNKDGIAIPRYRFKTLYRGRESALKTADSQGMYKIKALAGQKITFIDENGSSSASSIVTHGSKNWKLIIGNNIVEEDINRIYDNSASDEGTLSEDDSLDEQENINTPTLEIEKPQVIETERIKEDGPTLEVKSTEANIVIRFIDEATNQPLSGLTYYTKSSKYGKNSSVTGNDGTRGRPHKSLSGVEISVIVVENGKEVIKGTIIADSDRDEPYVYKAKKPSYSDVKVKFTTKRTDVVSEKTKTILRELASKNGMSQIVITSTLRTPEEQARAMYNNIARGRIITYKTPGAKVTEICQQGLRKKLGKNQIIKNMVAKILEYDRKGDRVSLHCVSFDTYAKKNIIDLGINSNGFNSTSKQRKFQAVCEQAKKEGKISRILSPLTNKGEPAFHLEIPQ